MISMIEPPQSQPASPPQSAVRAPAAAATDAVALQVRELSVHFGARQVLKQVSMDIQARAVTAIIGPSGCGKSTFLRAMNRMHDLVPSARVEGAVRLFGQDIYAADVEPVIVRRRV